MKDIGGTYTIYELPYKWGQRWNYDIKAYDPQGNLVYHVSTAKGHVTDLECEILEKRGYVRTSR